MPGLIGSIYLAQCNNHLSVPNHFPKGTKASQQFTNYKYDLRVAKNSRISASYERDNILVLCEGVFLNNRRPIEDTVTHLYEKYVREGEKFVKSLHGSFQIIVVDARGTDNKYFLYSDHIASRQIFYTVAKHYLYFSPDIDQLIVHTKIRSIDMMAIVNFMISGHFPTGHTGIHKIKLLVPGKYLAIHAGSMQKRQYFHFNIKPDEQMNSHEASKALDTVLTARILDHRKHAEDSAILLSGGYDSQYIFYTIAKSVEDTSRLTTVSLGQEPGKRFADMAIARHTA